VELVNELRDVRISVLDPHVTSQVDTTGHPERRRLRDLSLR